MLSAMPIRDPVIDEAIATMGDNGNTALAAALGITAQALSQWTRVPPTRVMAVESITGIHRSRLRPDLYPPEREQAAQ